MSVKDEINAWFHRDHPDVPTVAYPETAQDGGHPVKPPNADPAYFQPKYPGLSGVRAVGVLPSVEDPDAHWLEATKQGHFIPYVGEEPHGLDINVDPSKVPIADVDLIAARGHAFGTPVGDPHQIPIPVVIIDTPSFFGVEKRFSTNVFTLVNSVPTLVCSKRPERTRVQLSCSAATTIGQTVEQVASGIGFTIPANTLFTMNVNQAVYAFATAGTPVVSVYEEFTVVEGQKRL